MTDDHDDVMPELERDEPERFFLTASGTVSTTTETLNDDGSVSVDESPPVEGTARRVEVTAAQALDIAAAVKAAAETGKPVVATTYWPRHRDVAIEDGVLIDIESAVPEEDAPEVD